MSNAPPPGTPARAATEAGPRDLPFSPAADRNRLAILAALERLLPPSARAAHVLEIASGTGQHAQCFAERHPAWTWHPTDADPAMLPVIDARCSGLANVRPARRLDVLQDAWPGTPAARAADGAAGGGDCSADDGASYSAVFCANLLHISPWATCAAVMQGAAARLARTGLLVLYGPYRIDGVPTAPSNEAFDADLKARDARWGLRPLSAVEAEAATAGLALQRMVAMPANNLLLAFGRGSARGPGVGRARGRGASA